MQPEQAAAQHADIREVQTQSHDHQHQQQQQQQQSRAPPAEPPAADEGPAQAKKEHNNTARSSSPNSNSSSDAPGRRQLKRTMLDLREDLDDAQDELQSLRLRTLWLMSQEVRRERLEAAKQLIIQGFDTRLESSNAAEAARQRDQYIAELLERLLRTPPASIQYTFSHATSLESLSRITIVTFQQPHYVSAVVRASGAAKHTYGPGNVKLSLKRQQPVFDRLTSAPAKILMESMSRQHPAMQNHFRPLWREGVIQNTYTGTVQTVATWHVNVHKGRIRLAVLPEYYEGVERDMGPGLMRLQFGPGEGGGDDAAASSSQFKGKCKGGGKAGGKRGKAKKTGPSLPIDPSMYIKDDESVRQKLGNMQFARYPFAVAVRKMEW